MKKIFLALCLPVLLASFYTLFPFQPPTAYADKCQDEDGLAIISIKPWYSGLCSRSADDCKPKAPDNDVRICSIPGDIIVIALNVLSIGMQLAGYAAVGLVIWGGIKYVLSNGDSGKIAAAKSTIQNALIGLLIVLVAVTLVDFVTKIYST